MGIFAQYPANATGNPFEKISQGRYFAFLTNRKTCFSLVSDDINDFKYSNTDLLSAMPMGYTNLWVLERVSLRTNDETPILFAEADHTLRYFYCALDSEGEYRNITEYEYKQFCNGKSSDIEKVMELAVNLVADYSWH